LNKNFCYNAFTGLDINQDGSIRPCCKFSRKHIPQFNISQGIQQYRNSKWLKQLQYDFIQGKRPAGCNRCWQDEDAGIQSRRQADHERFSGTLANLKLTEKKFSIVGIAFNNLCNLACRVCGPWASSTWIAEEKKHLGDCSVKVSAWHQNPAYLDDLYNYTNSAVLLEMVGGEPFLAEFTDHLDFLKRFVHNKQSEQIKLHYITNATCMPKPGFLEAWQQFKNVEITLSLDDIGERFEYNRWPAKWDQVYQNIKAYQQLAIDYPNIRIGIAYTVSAFSIYYAGDFVEWCNIEGLPHPWFGLVSIHPHYHPGVLNTELKQTIRKKLSNSASAEVQKLVNFLDDVESDPDKFLAEVARLDSQRKQNFSLTFPELSANMKSTSDILMITNLTQQR